MTSAKTGKHKHWMVSRLSFPRSQRRMKTCGDTTMRGCPIPLGLMTLFFITVEMQLMRKRRCGWEILQWLIAHQNG